MSEFSQFPYEEGKEESFRVIVTSDPGSNPPEWVRQAWLCVEFDAQPVIPLLGLRETPTNEVVESKPVWKVNAVTAIDTLREMGQYEAADWWETKGYCKEHTYLYLAITSCETVEGSQIVFPDMN